MPKNQYNAPAMEVVEFGKEDNVCTFSGFDVVTPGGDNVGHGPVIAIKPGGSLPDWGGD